MLSAVLLKGTIQLDEELRGCTPKRLWGIWFVCCIVAVGGFLCGEVHKVILPKPCFLILVVYLVICTTMDSQLCKVNNFMQYIGLIGGIGSVLNCVPQPEVGSALLMFAFVQYVLFRKMYGAADVMAFLICALYLAAEGRGIEYYLYHMAVCYLLLTLVQAMRGNIGRSGRLKKPVALYPYISASFLLIIYQ